MGNVSTPINYKKSRTRKLAGRKAWATRMERYGPTGRKDAVQRAERVRTHPEVVIDVRRTNAAEHGEVAPDPSQEGDGEREVQTGVGDATHEAEIGVQDYGMFDIAIDPDAEQPPITEDEDTTAHLIPTAPEAAPVRRPLQPRTLSPSPPPLMTATPRITTPTHHTPTHVPPEPRPENDMTRLIDARRRSLLGDQNITRPSRSPSPTDTDLASNLPSLPNNDENGEGEIPIFEDDPDEHTDDHDHYDASYKNKENLPPEWHESGEAPATSESERMARENARRMEELEREREVERQRENERPPPTSEAFGSFFR